MRTKNATMPNTIAITARLIKPESVESKSTSNFLSLWLKYARQKNDEIELDQNYVARVAELTERTSPLSKS
jgi:hypothetical protein